MLMSDSDDFLVCFSAAAVIISSVAQNIALSSPPSHLIKAN